MATKEFDERLYDRRVVQRNIKLGLVAAKDYERFLKSLEDDEDASETVDTTLGSSGQTPRSAEQDEE